MKTAPTTKIVKTDAAKQIVYGEVYAPHVLDSYGDFMTAEEIEKAAHNFLRSGFVNEIDTEHDLVNNGSQVVESFVVRKGDPDFTEGAWVIGVHIPDTTVWAQVEKGEIGGFSMYGEGQAHDVLLEIEVPDDGLVKGETYECEDHTHQYVIEFNAEGTFMGGITDEVNGHSHIIRRGTTTELAGDSEHSHRFNFRENLQ